MRTHTTHQILFPTLLLAFTISLLLGLSGCSCDHEWQDATCARPMTCAKCGEISGGPLGHNWHDATCTEPETCSVCGETNGTPLGHKWRDATCTEPETCSVCGETKGEIPGHGTLDSLGVCPVCGQAVGIALTMENYTQYLTLSMSSQKLFALKCGTNDYTPTVEYTLSVTPNSHYTYHDVRVTFKCTTTNTSRWENYSGWYDLTESGLFPGDKSTWYSTHQATSGGSRWSYKSESAALQVSPPKYSFSIVEITGYVIPA